MTVEIRAVREQELEEMIELQCLVFRPRGHERYNAYIHGDSSFELDQVRVVVDDGEIVATLRVWDRTVRVGGTAVKMGGIGGVGTHPDHRRRGHASAMLRDAVDWMRSRGYLTSVLFTEVATEFYRRHGWASVPMPGFRIAAPGAGAALPGPGESAGEWRVEAFDEARDLEAAMALYGRYNAAPKRLPGQGPGLLGIRAGEDPGDPPGRRRPRPRGKPARLPQLRDRRRAGGGVRAGRRQERRNPRPMPWCGISWGSAPRRGPGRSSGSCPTGTRSSTCSASTAAVISS